MTRPSRSTILLLPVLVPLSAACGESRCSEVEALPEEESILAIGDSLLGIERDACRGVPGALARELGNRVDNVAVAGQPVSSASGGDDIRGQYTEASRDWVLFSGGINDLIEECRCNANVDEAACDAALDALVSADGTSGEVPGVLDRALADGARVIVVGYYRAPDDAAANFDACEPQVTELARRYRAYTDAAPAEFYDSSDVMDFDQWCSPLDDRTGPLRIGRTYDEHSRRA